MKVYLSACLLFTGVVYGQPSMQLRSLVKAEREFAQTSKEKSTKEAFTTYMSDSGFIFQSGPVPGKKFWQEAEQGADLLTWEPVFADISSSGDMGYTTGPWEFRAKRSDADPAGTGYYVSVWKKEKDEWKVALDIGISHAVSLLIKETLHYSTKPTATPKMADDKIVKKELLDKEQEFINAQNKNNWAAYLALITADTRIYRPGSAPFITDEQRNQLFSGADKKFSYQTIDAIVASSGDLGYAYGKAIIAIKNDGNTKTLNGNYLRIWKKEDGTNWKLVLDLVNIAR
jgi:ketosteroid isomerase-like protein